MLEPRIQPCCTKFFWSSTWNKNFTLTSIFSQWRIWGQEACVTIGTTKLCYTPWWNQPETRHWFFQKSVVVLSQHQEWLSNEYSNRACQAAVLPSRGCDARKCINTSGPLDGMHFQQRQGGQWNRYIHRIYIFGYNMVEHSNFQSAQRTRFRYWDVFCFLWNSILS